MRPDNSFKSINENTHKRVESVKLKEIEKETN